MTRTMLVVVDEHTLGYVYPEQPTTVWPLHKSILRGAVCACPASAFDSTALPANPAQWRLATEQDFNDYRVLFDGFRNDTRYLHA